MKNNNDLVTTIMWGVALGISLERVIYLSAYFTLDVIHDKFLNKRKEITKRLG